MVNVLPQKQKRALTLRYYLSLGTLLCVALAIVFSIGSVSLVPSYFASRAQADSYERYRDALSGALGLRQREGVEVDMATLVERVRIANEFGASAFSVELLEALDAARGANITITALSFSRTDKNTVHMAFSGSATTRTALLAFVDALRASGVFENVALPVSQLVVETKPTFSIQADARIE